MGRPAQAARRRVHVLGPRAARRSQGVARRRDAAVADREMLLDRRQEGPRRVEGPAPRAEPRRRRRQREARREGVQTARGAVRGGRVPQRRQVDDHQQTRRAPRREDREPRRRHAAALVAPTTRDARPPRAARAPRLARHHPGQAARPGRRGAARHVRRPRRSGVRRPVGRGGADRSAPLVARFVPARSAQAHAQEAREGFHRVRHRRALHERRRVGPLRGRRSHRRCRRALVVSQRVLRRDRPRAAAAARRPPRDPAATRRHGRALRARAARGPVGTPSWSTRSGLASGGAGLAAAAAVARAPHRPRPADAPGRTRDECGHLRRGRRGRGPAAPVDGRRRRRRPPEARPRGQLRRVVSPRGVDS
mmetsp:Transcript_6468/g.27226  ORF Transcript_6468/g.27226 Transcript_6468/m.27226 type:complete len:365 (-) Transcript_6468:777-1871(-)